METRAAGEIVRVVDPLTGLTIAVACTRVVPVVIEVAKPLVLIEATEDVPEVHVA
jgi:hypothetical protein